jgi:hypothetical protein
VIKSEAWGLCGGGGAVRSVLLSLFLRLVMGRLAWLKRRMQYGNPNTRMREMRFFLSFEI